MMSQPNSTDMDTPEDIRVALLSLYGIILFFGGLASTLTLMSILNSNMRSMTTLSVINLILVHYIFLLTVPFRIHYYAVKQWNLGLTFCRLVSATIHGHMLLAFIFYIIILVIRDISYFKKTDKLTFYRRLHAIAFSVAIWTVILGILIPLTFSSYGGNDLNSTKCFNFGAVMQKEGVRELNYALSGSILLIIFVFTCLQLFILIRVLLKFKMTAFKHQEFWAQFKSFLFISIMVVCFFPYHVFRIHYVRHHLKSGMEDKNEVFLALTALSCFDMLIFLGRSSYITLKMKCCF